MLLKINLDHNIYLTTVSKHNKLHFVIHFLLFYLDSSLYANHVFNVFDQDRDGKVSFEVTFF